MGDLQALLLISILVLVAGFLLDCFNRWWGKRYVARLAQKAIKGGLKEVRLIPESLHVVELSDWGITCNDPDGKVETVGWDELTKVEIVTNDHGPWLPDCFWVLHGKESGCVVPWGATGEKVLLTRLQALPGFDNEAVGRAACSTSWDRFLCWNKEPSIVEPKQSESES